MSVRCGGGNGSGDSADRGSFLPYNRSVVRNVLKFLTGGLAIVAIGASLLYFTQYLGELVDSSYPSEYGRAGR